MGIWRPWPMALFWRFGPARELNVTAYVLQEYSMRTTALEISSGSMPVPAATWGNGATPVVCSCARRSQLVY